jgi:hypothetical protein
MLRDHAAINPIAIFRIGSGVIAGMMPDAPNCGIGRQLSYFYRRLQPPSIGCLSGRGQSRRSHVRSCTDNGFGFYYARPVISSRP